MFRHALGHNLLHDYGDGSEAQRLDLADTVSWLGDGVVILDTASSAGCPMDGGDVREWIHE